MFDLIRVIFWMALAFWIGGLTLFGMVITPALLRSLDREQAGKTAGCLFPAVDRWTSLWAVAASCSLVWGAGRLGRDPRLIFLQLLVFGTTLLTLYVAWLLHPQIQDHRQNMERPEFQGTVHLEKLQFVFQQLHRRSVKLHAVTLFLGWFLLALAARWL